jgi:hypothetical protein
MREILVDELGKIERYTLVDGPGPDVLILVGGVIDVVSAGADASAPSVARSIGL